MPVEKGEIVYYARILVPVDIFCVLELTVRMVSENWFTAYETKSKQVYSFNMESINKVVFRNRKDAIAAVEEGKKHKREISKETYYEEF